MGSKWIFLDVDGVLNNDFTEERIPDTNFIGIDNHYVKQLKRIVQETGAMICLTSTWRISKSHDDDNIQDALPYLQKKLRKYGLRYVSTTPFISHYKRGHEIKEWFEKNNDIVVDSWVILDDEDFPDYKELDMESHLVLTNHVTALSEQAVEQAIKILNGEDKNGED